MLFVQGLRQDFNPVRVSLFVFGKRPPQQAPSQLHSCRRAPDQRGRCKAARVYVTSQRQAESCLCKVISDARRLQVNVRGFQHESRGGGERKRKTRKSSKRRSRWRSANLRAAHTNATAVSEYFSIGTSPLSNANFVFLLCCLFYHIVLATVIDWMEFYASIQLYRYP